MRIQTWPVYSKLAEEIPDEAKAKLPTGWRLSQHQVETYQALTATAGPEVIFPSRSISFHALRGMPIPTLRVPRGTTRKIEHILQNPVQRGWMHLRIDAYRVHGRMQEQKGYWRCRLSGKRDAERRDWHSTQSVERGRNEVPRFSAEAVWENETVES